MEIFRELARNVFRNLYNNALIHGSNLGNPRDENPYKRQIRQILLKKAAVGHAIALVRTDKGHASR